MPNKKKVMFLISSNKNVIGGHYYSLRTTAEALSSSIIPIIVSIGTNRSPILELSKVLYIHVYSNGWNNIGTIINMCKLIKEKQPDVIHGSDWGMPVFGRSLSFLYKIPYISTLPGGGNPTVFYPYVKDLILFSKENYDYFKTHKKFSKTNLYLIPNRITSIAQDQKRIEILKEKIEESRKTFLRISRFALHYKESIIQAINLVAFLNERGLNSQLIIIGTIEDRDVYNAIMSYIDAKKEKNIHIFTELLYTVNASELIDIADFVIGTGRGFMEASSRSKVMFTPVKNSELPVLINESNFLTYFNTNFSPRNILMDKDIEVNKKNIVTLLEDEDKIIEEKIFSENMFKKYFDITNKKEDYIRLYENLEYDKQIHFIEFLELCLRQLRAVTRRT